MIRRSTGAAISIVGTAWFNPLVRGGSEYLRDNELSRQILALDRGCVVDRKGRPTGWELPIRDILAFKGAGFIVPIAGHPAQPSHRQLSENETRLRAIYLSF